MKQKDVPVLQYPWPYEIGPYAELFYEEQDDWINADYQFMSEATRNKYKKHGLVQAASYMFPAAKSMEQLRPHISKHPVILRLKMLMCRIMAIQNDSASLEKELAVDTEKLNVILVMRHQYKISLEEACAEAMRLHDDYLKEFVELQANLPDFGSFQKDIENFVHHMTLMIAGLGAWYHVGRSTRYKVPGEYPRPEYGHSYTDGSR